MHPSAQWASGRPPWSGGDTIPSTAVVANNLTVSSNWTTGSVSSAGVAMPDEIEVAYALTQRQMEAVFAKNASAPKR